MTSLIVTYLCVRILAPVPCLPCPTECPNILLSHEQPPIGCEGCWDYGTCHNEPIVEHELRSRIESDGYCLGTPRPGYTDSDWRCEPLQEIEMP